MVHAMAAVFPDYSAVHIHGEGIDLDLTPAEARSLAGELDGAAAKIDTAGAPKLRHKTE